MLYFTVVLNILLMVVGMSTGVAMVMFLKKITIYAEYKELNLIIENSTIKYLTNKKQ